MPSHVENSPYTVLECIGRGIPFLASSVGGTPELIRSDWRKAVLFQNSPEDLCRAIKWILAEVRSSYRLKCPSRKHGGSGWRGIHLCPGAGDECKFRIRYRIVLYAFLKCAC